MDGDEIHKLHIQELILKPTDKLSMSKHMCCRKTLWSPESVSEGRITKVEEAEDRAILCE